MFKFNKLILYVYSNSFYLFFFFINLKVCTNFRNFEYFLGSNIYDICCISIQNVVFSILYLQDGNFVNNFLICLF